MSPDVFHDLCWWTACAAVHYDWGFASFAKHRVKCSSRRTQAATADDSWVLIALCQRGINNLNRWEKEDMMVEFVIEFNFQCKWEGTGIIGIMKLKNSLHHPGPRILGWFCDGEMPTCKKKTGHESWRVMNHQPLRSFADSCDWVETGEYVQMDRIHNGVCLKMGGEYPWLYQLKELFP